MAYAPADNFLTPMEDSRRWRNVIRRPGDIIISTPPKSGTTWMQGIVTSLLWPTGDAPGTRAELSPWIDATLTPIGELVEQVDAQTHRRYFKTHSPGDCIPFDQQCRYIVVYRDGRDALVSWGNHRATMRPEIVELMNRASAKLAVEPLAPVWNGDYDALFDEWSVVSSPLRHLASWWPRRHETNVLFVHYGDLKADLEAEMRRIAGFLELNVPEQEWPAAVRRCGLHEMRAEAKAIGGLESVFEGGADAFYFKGTNGRWRDALTAAQIARYQALVEETLADDAAIWLEHGSRELGVRPEQLGMAEATTLDTGAFHPLLSRLGRAQQPANSIDAIAERAVAQAREAGLFDDLALQGKPIPDLDRHRQPGWWANQFVAKERRKVQAIELEDEIRGAMPALWRLTTAAEVAEQVRVLNERIGTYNEMTTESQIRRLDLDETLATWQRLRYG